MFLRGCSHSLQDASGAKGALGSVAAGDEAALPNVPYQLGYALREVGVDFQVRILVYLYRSSICFVIAMKMPDRRMQRCARRRARSDPKWIPSARRALLSFARVSGGRSGREYPWGLCNSVARVCLLQELGEAAQARAGRQHSFEFLQQGEQAWQPAFLTSIDHQPSTQGGTPTFAMGPAGRVPHPEPPPFNADEESATPLSEVCLYAFPASFSLQSHARSSPLLLTLMGMCSLILMHVGVTQTSSQGLC